MTQDGKVIFNESVLQSTYLQSWRWLALSFKRHRELILLPFIGLVNEHDTANRYCQQDGPMVQEFVLVVFGERKISRKLRLRSRPTLGRLIFACGR
jgi:hypothetical protein